MYRLKKDRQEKKMFRCFFPDEYVDSTYVIDFEKLYQEGYRGLIFDIDNTLVPHGAPADTRAIDCFGVLRSWDLAAAFYPTIRRREWLLLMMRSR